MTGGESDDCRHVGRSSRFWHVGNSADDPIPTQRRWYYDCARLMMRYRFADGAVGYETPSAVSR